MYSSLKKFMNQQLWQWLLLSILNFAAVPCQVLTTLGYIPISTSDQGSITHVDRFIFIGSARLNGTDSTEWPRIVIFEIKPEGGTYSARCYIYLDYCRSSPPACRCDFTSGDEYQLKINFTATDSYTNVIGRFSWSNKANTRTVYSNETRFLSTFTGSKINEEEIVSPSYIQEDGSFTVTCDASRAGVPTTASTITKLFIAWADGPGNIKATYAKYFTDIYPYTISNLPDTYTPRNWTFNFSGGLQDTSDKPNNRNTMQVKIVVFDARCTDAGLYFCNATYFDRDGEKVSTYKQQYVNIDTNRLSHQSLYLEPRKKEEDVKYESFNATGSDINLTCSIFGPKELIISWKFGKANDDVNSFTTYNGGYTKTSILIFRDSCTTYYHQSQITFHTEDRYDSYMYVCVVKANNMDTFVRNITIPTKPNSQTIVSPSYIQEDGSFTVTCDASRAGVPTTASTITKLFIVMNWEGLRANYATYFTSIYPYNNSFPPDDLPPRNWTFNFSGGLQDTSDRPNNTNTMKIEMVVYDAKCTDRGWYNCKATYINDNDFEISTYQEQYVPIITNRTDGPLILSDLQDEGKYGKEKSVYTVGSNVTLACVFNGPKELIITWKFGNSSDDVNTFITYNGYVNNQQFPTIWDSCVSYKHRSEITFQIEDTYDGYMYVCVVKANNKNIFAGNMTIHTKQSTQVSNITNNSKAANSTDIVSPRVIVEGEPFTVKCDASRAKVPKHASTVSNLFIDWTNGTAPLINYASYRLFIPPYNTSYLPHNSPTRNWTILFNGSQQGTSERPMNRNTIKIEILVNDAYNSDQGIYFCNATYFDENDVERAVYMSQTFTNETQHTSQTPVTKIEVSKQNTNDYSILYYVVPLVTFAVVGVLVLVVYYIKVHRKREILKIRKRMPTPPKVERIRLQSVNSDGYLVPLGEDGGYAVINEYSRNVLQIGACNQTSVYDVENLDGETYYSTINDLENLKNANESCDSKKEHEQNQTMNVNVSEYLECESNTNSKLNIEGECQSNSNRDEQKEIISNGKLDTNLDVRILDSTTDVQLDIASNVTTIEINFNVKPYTASEIQLDLSSNRKHDNAFDGKLNKKSNAEYNAIPTYGTDDSISLQDVLTETVNSTDFLGPTISSERIPAYNLNENLDQKTNVFYNSVPGLEINGYNKLYDTTGDTSNLTEYLEPVISLDRNLENKLKWKLKKTNSVSNSAPTHKINDYLKLYDTTGDTANLTDYLEPAVSLERNFGYDFDEHLDENCNPDYYSVPVHEINNYAKLYDTNADTSNLTESLELATYLESAIDNNLDEKLDEK